MSGTHASVNPKTGDDGILSGAGRFLLILLMAFSGAAAENQRMPTNKISPVITESEVVPVTTSSAEAVAAAGEENPSPQQQTQRLGKVAQAVDLPSTLKSIESRLTSIEAKVQPPSLLTEIGTGFLTNFLWEAFNFKEGTNSRVAQAAAALGFVFTMLRIFFFIKDRRAGMSVGRTAVEASTVTYLLLMTAVLGALVYSGGFLREELATTTDIAGLRTELQGLRAAVHDLRGVPTVDVLARSEALTRQMAGLQKQLTTRESVQLASLTEAVENTRNHTAAFWLQLFELIGVVVAAVCGIALVRDRFF